MNTFAQIRQVSVMLGDGWRFIDRNLPGEKVYLWRGSDTVAVDTVGQVRSGSHVKRMKPKRVRGAVEPKLPHRKGENNPRAKLNDEQVKEIRRLCSPPHRKQRDVAAYYGINQSVVSAIVSRKSWAHVT